MRRAILLLMLFAGGLPGVTLAQGALLRTVATAVRFPPDGTAQYSLQCPAGYVPTGFSSAPATRLDDNSEVWRDMIDRGKAVIDRRSVASAAALDGAGFAAFVLNLEHHSKHLEIMLTCLSPAATSDNTLVLSKSGPVMVPRSQTGIATSFCPADYPVALGGFSIADGRAQLLDAGNGPVWGTSANPLLLLNVPDGQTGPPTGWQARVLNQHGFNAQEISATAVCGNVPGLQTFIYSASVPQANFSRTPFSIFAAVPDGWSALGQGYAGGAGGSWAGEYFATDAWNQDGVIVNMLQYNLASQGYDSGSAEVRAFIAQGLGAAPAGGARAVMAVLAVPKPSSPAATIEIVEYYHAALDHYFITGIPDEITKLDNGTFVGWQRTGQTFRAYAAGSGGGNIGRRPVCRAYGNPQYGLDTHFYSASPDECRATLLNGVAEGTDPVRSAFWGLEASEVFQMDLPHATTGACPAGGVPIYRVWNRRIDSNHRYSTSIAMRDEMVARGGVAEGYGPNAVALCGLP